MIHKYLISLLSVVGLCFAVWTVVSGGKPVPAAPPIAAPPKPPFAHVIAGAGVVEPTTENIAIGTPISGIVVGVPVTQGTKVTAGDVLFRLDDRDLQAEGRVRETNLQAAQAKLTRLLQLPRAEDLPPAIARVEEFRALRDDAASQLAFVENLATNGAVSKEEISLRRFALQAAESRYNEAQAQLSLLQAGAWSQDIDVATAELAVAEAQLQAVRTDIDRLTVRAPVNGVVLKVNIRPGEYAPSGQVETPLVIMGDTSELQVRVDVDESDVWRISPNTEAVAFVRGNAQLRVPLRYWAMEPMVVPKRSLTGNDTERVDTRVLQLLYRFQPPQFPIYVGQQLDVFIDAGATSSR